METESQTGVKTLFAGGNNFKSMFISFGKTQKFFLAQCYLGNRGH